MANRSANKKQHMMQFYVDVPMPMSSHTDERVNDEFSVWLNEEQGEHTEMKATRGCMHDHLGIAFGFVDGKVKINMVEHISNMSKEFPVKFKEMNRNNAPAGVDLLTKI